MRKPGLQIVIVNWNSGSDLRRCLDSIDACLKTGYSIDVVTVVDNQSSDGSLGLATSHSFGFNLQLIANSRNEGFARACNAGAATSKSEYLLFLNPDIRLLPDCIDRTIAFVDDAQRVDIGICGVQLVDEHGTPTNSVARFPTLQTFVAKALGLSRLFPNRFKPLIIPPAQIETSRVVDQVVGAFFLIRRAVFEACNGFDERFFVFYEELDLCLRARRRDVLCYFLKDVHAIHKAKDTSMPPTGYRLFLSMRSGVLYIFKNLGFVQGLLFLSILFAIDFPLRVAWTARLLKVAPIYQLIIGFFMLVRDTPRLVATGYRDFRAELR